MFVIVIWESSQKAPKVDSDQKVFLEKKSMSWRQEIRKKSAKLLRGFEAVYECNNKQLVTKSSRKFES